jgi:hypothetical protein
MKNKTLIILISLSCISNYSQSVNPRTSLAFYLGTFIPFSGQANQVYPTKGFNTGLDFQIYKNKFGVFVDFNFNYSKTDFTKYGNPFLTYLSNPGYYLMNFSLGPRWFIGSGKIYGDIDLGICADFRKHDGYSYVDDKGNITNIESTKFGGPGIGTTLGGMLNFALTKKIEFTIKSRFNLIGFPPVCDLYFVLSGGLRIKL